MYDSIRNVGDFLSPHWLAEAFPGKLKTLTKEWRERTEHGKHSPLRGLTGATGKFLTAKASLPQPHEEGYAEAVTKLHSILLDALGYDASPTDLDSEHADTAVTVPLLARHQSPTGEALHVLQAHPVPDVDDLFSDEGRVLDPVRVQTGKEKVDTLESVPKAVQQLFLTEHAPRYVLVLAGGWILLSDVERWAEGRYLAFDVDTALSRKDDKATGELAWHAGLVSADVLLPSEDGASKLAEFSEDSVKHAVGVSEDLREGLRVSVELIANEVIAQRRAKGEPVEGIPELPRELTTQSLRFLYRILFLLYAEARPEQTILPVGDPDYDAGYGLDRLREMIQRPLTGASRDGHHLHDSLRLLFRLVNTGHNAGLSNSDGMVFEPLRADLFEPRYAHHIDNVNLSNHVLQQVLALLLLSKVSKKKGERRGYVSYAQLGINQLGAVYEGLMAYSGFIAERELAELAKDGNPAKGTWLVPRENLGQYDEKHVVRREDPLTDEERNVVHPKGTFVYRLSGRDRQRSASYYTPEVLTQCVVRHSLAELISEDTRAQDILEYRICEPAMGSGAFLNEAINQLAAEYLQRRQAELNETIDPEEYRAELQKVKAYLALHRCYGVDLNDTARELAEVSLWLNVMHPGLKAPWFGLHLKRGNSLIGARRATYDLAALGRAKQSWLKTPPTDRPLTESDVPAGEIHHFLLPAAGWGAVKDAKQAKELAPDKVEQLKAWARSITRKPGKSEVARLRGLARRVERLWELSRRRLEISEREIARHIEVWGAEIPADASAVTRERVESELNDPDGPYQRLRLAMDAWCALFFWPITTDVEPPNLDQWLTVLEGLLGINGKDAPSNQVSLVETVEGFDELANLDELEKTYYGMRDVTSLFLEHRWLGVVREVAQQEGFFHWELDFAQVFSRGGFDLQLGNPPWVQPKWKDEETLAEFEPFFVLKDNIPDATFRQRRSAVVSDHISANQYLTELSSWAGLNEHLGSPVEHPLLRGIKTNLYNNFMERTWRSMNSSGVVGMLHPEGHLNDPKAGTLRHAAYRRLRRHWSFVNELKLFEDIDNHTVYGIHIYSTYRNNIGFRQVAKILTPDTLESSLTHDGAGDIPAIQYAWGGWDLRPHASRVVYITEHTLKQWSALFDEPGTPPGRARLVLPISEEQLEILTSLSNQSTRMGDIKYKLSTGWDEGKAKRTGHLTWRTEYPPNWDEVVLQGPHFSVATPLAKQPNEDCKSMKDYSDWNLEEISDREIPRTNYQRAIERKDFNAALTNWNGRSYTDYYRLAWRRRTNPGLERTLTCALITPGPTHVNTVHTLACQQNIATAVAAGLWSSLPFDYLVKSSGKGDVQAEMVERFPAPLDHRAAPLLLIRTLRLNCLTRDYAPLWDELYDPNFATDSWTSPFKDWPQLGVAKREWCWETPLRSEFERRAALVEIDALAAIMLGLTADQLCLMYRGQFAVLRKYEYNMYFDNLGQKIAKDHHAHGVKQQPEDFKLLQNYLNEEDCGDLLDRYEPPITPVDREAEMRAAYDEFTRRLEAQQ